jgi:elongation factor P
MLGITDLKTGTAIVYNNDPHIVLKYEHSKQGRSGAVMRTKLKNLRNGATFDITFKGGDKFDEASLQRRQCSYLYKDGEDFAFMDSQNFDQFSLSGELIADKANYLKEGTEVQVLFFEDMPVSIELPIKMEFEIAHTEPGVRGDTATGGTKPATLETGLTITVPLFVKIGDIIRVNTVEGTYVERANK